MLCPVAHKPNEPCSLGQRLQPALLRLAPGASKIAKKTERSGPLSDQRLLELVEEATVDAYG